MRSLHTPQQETNVAYNPGVSYRGGEFIAQGISQAGNAITAGLQRYAQNREESAALDMSFQTRAQPLLEEMQKFSAKDGQVSPAAGLVDKGADWHKFSSSQKKAFLADVVIMGDKQDRARRQQQEDDFRKAAQQFQQDQFTQLTSYQNEMQRLQALSTGATVSNINSEIAQRDRIASQDNAVGQGLAAYARSGTNLNPDFSYSDYANRGFGLGNATLPEASTPFTHQQRMERAMTTPGLGGRGSIQLQEELRKLGGSQETPLDLARISLLTAQAEAARASSKFDNKPTFFNSVDNPGGGLPPGFKRIVTGPNTSQIVYQPDDGGAAVAITAPDGSPLGFGLPSRTGGVTPLPGFTTKPPGPTVAITTTDADGNKTTRKLTAAEEAALPPSIPADIQKKIADLRKAIATDEGALGAGDSRLWHGGSRSVRLRENQSMLDALQRNYGGAKPAAAPAAAPDPASAPRVKLTGTPTETELEGAIQAVQMGAVLVRTQEEIDALPNGQAYVTKFGEVNKKGTAPSASGASPPPAAIEYLRANPGERAAFDAKYGSGAAARALGR